jgi:hypothetical protein
MVEEEAEKATDVAKKAGEEASEVGEKGVGETKKVAEETKEKIGSSTLTVTTNKSNYLPGETIVVTGKATASSDVTIQLFNPLNALVDMTYFKSGADGSYSKSLVIPLKMPISSWVFGTYRARAFSGTESIITTFTITAV